jgi:nucleoside-diphosphate-sugar epimerase
MIGVTGASGRLGKTIVGMFPGLVVPIYRQLPAEGLPYIIHAATIRGRSKSDAEAFAPFNDSLADYVAKHGSRVVNVGSCWQLLEGTCRDQPYTALKDTQERLFSDAVHVYPYWIYGPAKGFIFDLKQHLAGGPPLRFVGRAPLDLIYVADVARACLMATGLPAGRYAIASGVPTVPAELAARYGVSVRVEDDLVTARLDYPLPIIGNSLVTVDDFINSK